MGNLIGMHGISMSPYFDPKRMEECVREIRCPVVTLSRSFGSNGSKIAELLAESLAVPCFGYSMLDGIIKETKTDKFLMRLIDEQAPNPLEDWIHTLLTKGDASKEGFHQRLIKVALAIAESGGVIIGRGAHLLLAEDHKVFRVRIEGSLDVCAKRVAEREHLTTEEAKKLIAGVDSERKLFVKGIYNRHPTQRAHYDLVLNSDDISIHTAVEIIILVMEKMGFYVPDAEAAHQKTA
ncbi:MAG: cytidylate kinase-like family protein [Magnetococcales bacterium]|nr:cytidylate kinase-like family protein [Magnetococcales bacterium]